MRFRLSLWLLVLCLAGCSGDEKTFIPEQPDPPPTQEEGTLNGPSEKTGQP